MTDPISAAIDHIRRITPSNDPWTAKDIAFEEQAPDEVDDSIATILNAVVAGQLIQAPSTCALDRVLRAEAGLIADDGTDVYGTDAPIAAARALLEELERPSRISALGYLQVTRELKATVATLADALEAERAENQRLRATLSAITATDCYSRDECTAMARAALRDTEASHDD